MVLKLSPWRKLRMICSGRPKALCTLGPLYLRVCLYETVLGAKGRAVLGI